MADKAVDNNQNAHLSDPNNNIGDNNIGNDNTDNNIDMVGPEKNYRDRLTTSSLTRLQPHEDNYHPPHNYEPNAY